MAKSRAKKVKLRPILIAVTCTWDKSFFCKTISLFQAFRYWYSPTEAAEGSKSLLTTVRWEEGQLYFPVWNTDQSAILLQKQSACVLWDMTFDTSACARRNFSRLFLSPVGLGQSTMWYDWWTEEDMAFERRSGWAKSAGNEPVVRWQNGLWNGEQILHQRAQVKNRPPNWT